ncbi:unnamed protein product [Caenorhabditis nigoni]
MAADYTIIIYVFSIFSDSYAYVVFQWIYYSVLDDVRRCDAFLGLAMASIRTFVLKFPMRSVTATSVSFGWKICLIIFLLSSIFSFTHLLRMQVVRVDYGECYGQFLNGTSGIVYTTVPSELTEWNNYLFMKVQLAADAIFSKIIPAVLFPILTFLLTLELQKIEESRSKMFSDSYQNKSSITTKFVFLNTIAYVISALPTGIVYILHFVLPKWCLEVQCYDYPDALTMLTSLMTLTHFPICLAMSTQYRSTVLELLRIKIEPRTTVLSPNAISGNAT